MANEEPRRQSHPGHQFEWRPKCLKYFSARMAFTAALVEPDQDTSANVSDEVSADFATTPVDNQWITHVYRGDADPRAGVAKM